MPHNSPSRHIDAPRATTSTLVARGAHPYCQTCQRQCTGRKSELYVSLPSILFFCSAVCYDRFRAQQRAALKAQERKQKHLERIEREANAALATRKKTPRARSGQSEYACDLAPDLPHTTGTPAQHVEHKPTPRHHADTPITPTGRPSPMHCKHKACRRPFTFATAELALRKGRKGYCSPECKVFAAHERRSNKTF